jgi:hypothetical protein|tara:strand:+ start:844 stop:1098 length:255 start_codon:yes stop_codon:yes gene_type:complete
MTKYILRNNQRVAMTAEEKSQWDILAEQSAIEKAEYDALEWKRNRQKKYPSWQDQMDMMWHDKQDDTTTWEDAVQAVKDANPKP